MLFAVDAAHQFGGQGEETQVLRVDERGRRQSGVDATVSIPIRSPRSDAKSRDGVVART